LWQTLNDGEQNRVVRSKKIKWPDLAINRFKKGQVVKMKKRRNKATFCSKIVEIA